MEQVYIPYWKWEDWINGMWRKIPKEQELEYLKKAIEFTGNHILYGESMGSVIKKWPNTMLNSLTNKSINRRAFLGHCACQYKLNIPEYIVRAAWKKLSVEQRRKADLIAEHHIKKWLSDYAQKDRRVRESMGEKMLF